MRHLAACAALLAALPAWADGQIQVDRAELFYDVRGSTDAAILEDLKRQARAVGEDHFASTTWVVHWQYDNEEPVRGTCRVKALSIRLVQRTTLPRWFGDGRLQGRWNRFVTALRMHERGHAEHGREAAEEISRTIGIMRAPDCAQLARQTEAKGDAIIQRHAAEDRQYDKATQHGRSQGAWWQVVAPPDLAARAAPRPARPQLEAMPAPALPAR